MTKNTGRRRNSRSGNITTKSGQSIKINHSLSDRKKAKKAERNAKKAAYLASLPKERWKRWLYRLKPKHLIEYWFSREGGMMVLKLIGASVVVGFFLTIGIFAYFRKDLPQIKDLSGNMGGSISYYDSTGKVLLWTDYNSIKRDPVASNQISPYMKEATVAIEDRNFYKEGAIDIRSIFRAALNDLRGRSLQGASTITEQLVKLDEGWTGQRSITIKIKEVILAIELDKQYSKDAILTAYLNAAPYGGLDYGVQAAAEDYFQTSAQNLTLAQAAMLSAIPQAPSYYSPYAGSRFNPEVTQGTFSASALIARQHYILLQMQQQGYISKAQEIAAEKVNILNEVHSQQGLYQNIKAPYFVLEAKQQLIDKYGASAVTHGGWKVITTLNMKLQQYAQQDVANNAYNVTTIGGNQEAMVAEDVHTGQVVAEVGGEDFSPNYPGGEINYANTLISPGSSMKPFVYAALIQNNNNVGASSYIDDSQQPLPGYPCTNKTPPSVLGNNSGGNCLWDDNYIYPGPVTLRYALGGSRNVPAVKASYEITPAPASALNAGNGTITPADVNSVNKWLSMANQAIGVKNAYACYAGITSLLAATAANQTQCYGDAAIGGGYISIDNQVNGDVTLARLGNAIPQTYILKITDSSGKTIYQWHQPKGTQVYNPDTAYIINSILDDPAASYLYPFQKFQHDNGWYNAVKTGTENDSRNGVMTAWNTQYAVIGFVGSSNLSKQLKAGQFENLTEPLTRDWLQQALAGVKPVNWVQPKNIKVEPAYVQRAYPNYGQEFPGPSTDVYPSWYVGGSSNGHSTPEVIDRISGLLATSCTPPLARETLGYYGNQNFNADIFAGGQPTISGSISKNTTAATDNVHNCNQSPPKITLVGPPAGVCNGSCTITATASQGTQPFVSSQYPQYPGAITFYLNGNQIKKDYITSSPSTVSFTYNPTSSGSGSLSATVTDSLLYSDTSSTNITYNAPMANFSATVSGNNDSFSWTGGTSGTFNITDTSTGVTICSSSSSPCVANGAASNYPVGTPVTITDSAGYTQTATIGGP